MNSKMNCAATVLMLALSAATAQSADQDWEVRDVSARYVAPPIEFAPCAQNASAECGELIVPVDYNNPHEGLFGMAVVRARATDPSRRIGVLIANPGGPGDSGIGFALGGLRVPSVIRLRERFDIISFDVRGSHRSRPVRCEMQPASVPERASRPELTRFFDELSRRIAQACVDQNGRFVTSVSTNNIARDMDVLRRALGERQITYVGYSYGTVLGAVYASRFPRRVRAMLLDSGFPPEFRDYRVEFRTEQAGSFELAFQHVGQLCSQEATCALRDPGLVAAFDELKVRLNSVPVTSEGLVLNGEALGHIVASLLQNERSWPEIVQVLVDARAGNYTRLFQYLAAGGGHPVFGASAFDAFTAITCNDYGTRRSAAQYLHASEAAGALFNRVESRFAVAGSVARCAAWPSADAPAIRNVRELLQNPILFMGNHFDPNTPLSWTRSLAHALGMDEYVFRYEGEGHLAFLVRGISCVDTIGQAYLFDLTVPAEGSMCPAQPVLFPPLSTP